jgi:hypothetical protein
MLLRRPKLFVGFVSQLRGLRIFFSIQQWHKALDIGYLSSIVGRGDLASFRGSLAGGFPRFCGLVEVDTLE